MVADLQISDKVTKLIEKGIEIPNPFSVEIGADVDIRRISGTMVSLYPGTRIIGKQTLICSGSKIGWEAPATLINCRLGRDVELRGGFFKDSLFLDRVAVGSGAQIREGCILEEESGGNHTIGLKQTILFPFVTLGSLVNFCDCLMAGGTSRKNHSEVGSSFIHFNYTPNQDKATASLIGDVPRGVMLDQPPIFLGGQGGLVGPARIGFGTVTRAGSVIRRDCPEGGKLLDGPPVTSGEKEFRPGYYADVQRRVVNNIHYVANLLALKEWYDHVRHRFFEQYDFGIQLHSCAADLIRSAIDERLKRLRDLSEQMRESMSASEKKGNDDPALLVRKREFMERWPELESSLRERPGEKAGIEHRDLFIRGLWENMERNKDYISCIQGLAPREKSCGTAWLQAVAKTVMEKAIDAVPSFRESTN